MPLTPTRFVRAIHTVHTICAVYAVHAICLEVATRTLANACPARADTLAQPLQDRNGLLPGDARIY